MRNASMIQEIRSVWEERARLLRSRLQHELNAMHVYCHLSGLIGKPYALALARNWERNVVYTHLLYRYGR